MSQEAERKFTQASILPMEEQDLDFVIQMGLATSEFQTGTDSAQFYSRKTLERWVKHKNGVTLIARAKDEVVGFFLGYYMEGPNDGYMNCIAIADGYRGQGVGGQLLEQALTQLEQKGVDDIRCDHVFGVTEEDNQEAIRFLEKHGLQRGKKFYYVETMLPRNK